MNLSSRQRKHLRALAHHLDPVVKIGKQGLTPQLIKAIDVALEDHELIKVKFIDHKDEKSEYVPEIVKQTNAEIAGIIGNIVILFRIAKDEEKRNIKLPK